jgi:hypothetical protein
MELGSGVSPDDADEAGVLTVFLSTVPELLVLIPLPVASASSELGRCNFDGLLDDDNDILEVDGVIF